MRRERDAVRSVQRMLASVLPEPWDIRLQVEEGVRPERPFAVIEQVAPSTTAGTRGRQVVTLTLTASLFLEQAASRQAAADAAQDLREDLWQAVKYGVDPDAVTPDRIRLFNYMPRPEVHRWRVRAPGGTFVASIGAAAAAPLPPSASAADLAGALATALGVDAGDVVGVDRGTGLWDIEFVGELAGTRPGLPTINGAGLTGVDPVAEVAVRLVAAAAPWRGDSDWLTVTSFGTNTVHDAADPKLAMVPVDLRLTFARGPRIRSGQRVIQRFTASP